LQLTQSFIRNLPFKGIFAKDFHFAPKIKVIFPVIQALKRLITHFTKVCSVFLHKIYKHVSKRSK
jgi:hypothetical protein